MDIGDLVVDHNGYMGTVVEVFEATGQIAVKQKHNVICTYDSEKQLIKVKKDENNQKFRDELEILINRHSMENNSDTPDYILANYVMDCLGAYAKAHNHTNAWFGFNPWARKEIKGPQPEDAEPECACGEACKAD